MHDFHNVKINLTAAVESLGIQVWGPLLVVGPCLASSLEGVLLEILEEAYLAASACIKKDYSKSKLKI